MRHRTLLIGKSKSILKRLSQALEREGIASVWSDNITQAVTNMHAVDFDLVAVGRGIQLFDKKLLQDTFRKQSPDILFVDGLAPIIPLLVNQIKYAYDSWSTSARLFSILNVEKTSAGLKMNFVVTEPVFLHVELYRQHTLFRTITESITLGHVTKGQHFMIFPPALFGNSSFDFMVVKNFTIPVAVQELKFLPSSSGN